jgi:hypothetical protein
MLYRLDDVTRVAKDSAADLAKVLNQTAGIQLLLERVNNPNFAL